MQLGLVFLGTFHWGPVQKYEMAGVMLPTGPNLPSRDGMGYVAIGPTFWPLRRQGKVATSDFLPRVEHSGPPRGHVLCSHFSQMGP